MESALKNGGRISFYSPLVCYLFKIPPKFLLGIRGGFKAAGDVGGFATESLNSTSLSVNSNEFSSIESSGILISILLIIGFYVKVL